MGANDYQMNYNVDLVFCIDTTGSMYPVLNMVKQNALNLYSDVMRVMTEKGKQIHQLRVRVVAYRDYLADGKSAMRVTDFFNLPQQSAEFERCVRELEADGGDDEPEDGLEALAYAMKSNWDSTGIKNRHVIVVWTDASTHPLGYGASAPNYPRNMARDFAELTDWWGDRQRPGVMNQSAKRLVLFAPDMPEWNHITKLWDNVICYPSQAGKGLQEMEYQVILNVIANTI